jgi:hypothetical protein
VKRGVWLRLLGLAGWHLVIGACSNDFDSGARLTKLRVLAVQADRPFARPGESVRLDVLAYDPLDRPLQWAFSTCTNPAASTVSSCLYRLDRAFGGLGDPAGLRVDIPVDVLSGLPEQARAGAAVGAMLLACPGEFGEGHTAGLPARCLAADRQLPLDQFEVGLKRIFIREHDRNRNPTITRLSWDGEDWPEDRIPEVDACPAEADDIDDCPNASRHAITLESSAPESGTDELGAGFAEQQIVHYYTTGGWFEHEVRVASAATNAWAAQSGPAQPFSLWLVLRDDRGGVSWTIRQVRLR